MSNGFELDSKNKTQGTAASAGASTNQPKTPNSSARQIKQPIGSQTGVGFIKSTLRTGNLAGFSTESLEKTFAAVERILNASSSDQIEGDLKVLKLNHRQQGQGYLSSVLLVLIKGNYRASHPLIIEDSDRLEPIRSRLGNETITLPRPAGDVLNRETEGFYEAITEKLLDPNIKPNENTYIVAGGTVVPSELTRLSIDEMVASPAFNNLIYLAKNALVMRIDEYDESQYVIDIPAYTDPNVNLIFEANIDYRPQAESDATNLPIRADACIVVEARNKTTRDRSETIQEESLEISRSYVYADLDYLSEDEMAERLNVNPKVTKVTQRYLPRIVITNAESGLQAFNIQTVALAIHDAVMLGAENRWMGLFLPHYDDKVTVNGNEVDLNAIGAVGYECTHLEETGGQPTFLNVNNSTEDLVDLLTTVVTPDIVYSIDVDPTAPNGWIYGTFLAEAQGVMAAQNSITSEINKMTNNKFGDILDKRKQLTGEKQLFVDEEVMIPRGLIQLPQGPVDTRQIGNLAMLNLCGADGNIEVVEDYSRLFTNSSEDQLSRLKKMIDTLKNMYGDNNVVIKGHWHRISLTGLFIDSLLEAFNACGYRPIAQNQSSFQSINRRRSNTNHRFTTYRTQRGFATTDGYSSGGRRNVYTGYGR